MKPSLEDERRALLEQIEASRAVYRRMLSGEPGDVHARSMSGPAQRGIASGGMQGRSPPVQWMMEHPLWVAGGVALLVLAAPRLLGAGRHAAQKRRENKRRARQRREQEPGGTARALVTAAMLLLRDPARMRMAARVAGSAWQWLQQRRRPPKTITTVTPTARVTTRVH